LESFGGVQWGWLGGAVGEVRVGWGRRRGKKARSWPENMGIGTVGGGCGVVALGGGGGGGGCPKNKKNSKSERKSGLKRGNGKRGVWSG